MSALRVSVIGAKGRLGSEILAELESAKLNMTLSKGVVEASQLGTENYLTTDINLAAVNCDVLIDASVHENARDIAAAACEAGCALLVLCTGHTKEELSVFHEAAKQIPVAIIPNASRGVFVMHELALKAKELLGSEFDIEISEIHHRDKKDAPSGTAISLANQIEEDFTKHRYFRGLEGGSREAGSLGVSSLRGGGVPGEHFVYFLGDNESIELRHSARSRRIFASGALELALRLQAMEASLYDARSLFSIN